MECPVREIFPVVTCLPVEVQGKDVPFRRRSEILPGTCPTFEVRHSEIIVVDIRNFCGCSVIIEENLLVEPYDPVFIRSDIVAKPLIPGRKRVARGDIEFHCNGIHGCELQGKGTSGNLVRCA